MEDQRWDSNLVQAGSDVVAVQVIRQVGLQYPTKARPGSWP